MSRVLEFNELANKNGEMKRSSMEYNSLLPDLQIIINDSYGSIDKINYVTNPDLLPDLGTYKIGYDPADFEKLGKVILATEKQIEKAVNSSDAEVLELSQSRTLGR